MLKSDIVDRLAEAKAYTFEDFMNAVDPALKETQAQIHASKGISVAESRELYESAQAKIIAIREGQARRALTC